MTKQLYMLLAKNIESKKLKNINHENTKHEELAVVILTSKYPQVSELDQ